MPSSTNSQLLQASPGPARVAPKEHSHPGAHPDAFGAVAAARSYPRVLDPSWHGALPDISSLP
jgi:hypothetical protein